jgi:hypothetical protein
MSYVVGLLADYRELAELIVPLFLSTMGLHHFLLILNILVLLLVLSIKYEKKYIEPGILRLPMILLRDTIYIRSTLPQIANLGTAQLLKLLPVSAIWTRESIFVVSPSNIPVRLTFPKF